MELARRGEGRTSPNPMVGAVVVRDDRVVGEGHHQRAGGPHAEIWALEAAAEAARGADIYVTLEPCCHTGRTGPCTEAIIGAGLGRVFVGAVDPNPMVGGKGVAQLRSAGIEVQSGVLEPDCRMLNEAFNRWITTHLPLVTVKLGQTLDGRIAARTGESRWITSSQARLEVHRMRAAADAVLVGSGTALADDPQLNVRGIDVEGLDPLRVLVDSKLSVPPSFKLFADPRIIVATAVPMDSPRVAAIAATGAEIWSLPGGDGRVDLAALIARLGSREPQPITSLMVEAGGTLVASLLRHELVDKLRLFVAPSVMGRDGWASIGDLEADAPAEAPQLEIASVDRIGPDLDIVAYAKPHQGA